MYGFTTENENPEQTARQQTKMFQIESVAKILNMSSNESSVEKESSEGKFFLY